MIYLGVVAGAALALYNCVFRERKPRECEHSTRQVANCVFCDTNERGKDRIANQKLAEGKAMRLLVDNCPVTDGHLLITSVADKKKAHELTDKEALQEHDLLKQTAGMLKTKYAASSYLLLHKGGRRAGQSVPHYHKHILPIRSKADFARVKRNFAMKYIKVMTGLSKPLSNRELHLLRLDIAQRHSMEAVVERNEDVAKNDTLAQIEAFERPMEKGHVTIRCTRPNVKFAHERTDEEVVAFHECLKKVASVFERVYKTADYVQIEENADDFVRDAKGEYRMHLYPVPRKGSEYFIQPVDTIKYACNLAKPLTRAAKAATQAHFQAQT